MRKGEKKMDKISRVYDSMQKKNVSQLLICDAFSIFYLTGKLIDAGERFFAMYIDSQNKIQKLFVNKLFAIDNIDGVEIIYYSDEQDPVELLAKSLRNESMLIDKNLPARFLLPLISLVKTNYIVSDILEYVRLIKTDEEIELMKKSSLLNDKAIGLLIENIQGNMSELEAVEILKSIKKDLKLDAYSFDPIIAFGKNAADPHHEPDDTKLKEGDCIVIDIGFIKDSYCSDMTRTVFYKSANDFDRKIYDIVLEANLRSIAKVKPNESFSQVDLAARDYIKQNGYGEYFTHRTGHSIGLECHEFGAVSLDNFDLLKPGMIFSIEPGIYLKNKLGVRIEDLVLVTEDGCEILNSYPKELKIIG